MQNSNSTRARFAEYTATAITNGVFEGRTPQPSFISEIIAGIADGYARVTGTPRIAILQKVSDMIEQLIVAEIGRRLTHGHETWSRVADDLDVPKSTLYYRYGRRVGSGQK